MGESRVRKQASTLPARVFATLASTFPCLTSTSETLIGFVRVNHQKAVPTQAMINIKIIFSPDQSYFNYWAKNPPDFTQSGYIDLYSSISYFFIH